MPSDHVIVKLDFSNAFNCIRRDLIFDSIATNIPEIYRLVYSAYSCEPVYRQDAAKRQTAGIVFTHRPKVWFFAPQGRLVAPIQVKLCSTDGHLGPLGCAKFLVNRCRRVGMRPQKYQKFPLFGKESPRRGDSLDRFPKFLGAFIHLTILR